MHRKLLLLVLLSSVALGLTADFSYNPIGGSAPLKVNFIGSSDTANIQYEWIYGDGTTDIGQSVTHIFTTPGIYNVTFIADAGTNTSSISKNITILPGTSDTTLQPSCSGQADKYGFVRFNAMVTYYQNGANYCANTNVVVSIGGLQITLLPSQSCVYSRYVQLPNGVYTPTFLANYPSGQKQVTCSMAVTSGGEASLLVYAPKNGNIYRTGDNVQLQASVVQNNQNILNGSMQAQLSNGSGNLQTVTMTSDQYGTFSGGLTLSVPDGQYIITFAASKGGTTYAQNNIMIVVNNSADVQTTNGAKINIIYPLNNQKFNANGSTIIEAQFIDSNQRSISNAVITADIIKNGQVVDTVNLDEKAYSYKKIYQFTSAGQYSIRVTGTKSPYTAQGSVSLIVGEASEIASSANFTVQILAPQSDTYAKGSTILFRARVRQDTTPIAGANVTLDVNGADYLMNYDRFGDYTYSVGPLPVNNYEAKVVAAYGNFLAEDSVLFSVSEHGLKINLQAPKESDEFVMKSGDAVNVSVDVVDEFGSTASGVLVAGSVIDSAGRISQLQLFQDVKDGFYKTTFFPVERGQYKMTLTASKLGFVGAISESKFTVQLQTGIFGLNTNLETLLTIVIGLAIIILLIAIFRVGF